MTRAGLNNMNSFWQLTAIHCKEYFREPGILFWTLAFPAAMAWILGVAFTGDIEPTHRVAFVDAPGRAPVALPRELMDKNGAAASKGRFHFVRTNPARAKELMRQGRVSLVLEKAVNGWTAHYDPRNSEAQLTFLKLERALAASGTARTAPVLHAERVTEKGHRYVDFLVPGLIALGVMNSCLWGIGWSLIELRIKKLMRRMVATPMRRWEFLLSFFVVRIVLSLVEGAVLFAFGRLYFKFEMQGSWAAFGLLFLAGNTAFCGMGVLLSCRAASTRTANGLINFVTLPLTIVGGVFFSYHNFPDWAARAIQYTPLALLADGLRAVSNEGVALAQVVAPSGALALFGVVTFAIGLRFYRWY